jgi:hypothetical protein
LQADSVRFGFRLSVVGAGQDVRIGESSEIVSVRASRHSLNSHEHLKIQVKFFACQQKSSASIGLGGMGSSGAC